MSLKYHYVLSKPRRISLASTDLYENCRRSGVAILYMEMSKVPIISGYVVQWGSRTIFTLIGGACAPSVITFGTPRLASIT
jgi:hypothetical protein